MVLSDISIKRPVFATVLSLLIVVFGVAALMGLPVREYPDIDPPIVSVSTDYTGAAAEVVDTQITQVIEGAISGIEGIRSIESSTEQGESRTSIEFNTSRDIDVAANDVRDAVARVANQLPDEADPPRIQKADSDARPMMWITLLSDVWDSAELSDFADRVLADRLSVLDGVADVRIGGERRYAIRVWLDRERLAARNITVAEVERALRDNNVELPAGQVDSSTRNFTVRAEGRLSSVEEFRNLVVRRDGNDLLRLGEIANVQMGVESDISRLRANGKTAIGLGIIRQSKANTVAVSDAVRAELELIRDTLPPEVSLAESYDESIFIRASIKEVLITLGIAVSLVILVIFLFLRSWRATLIPAVTIPVAVIGAFIGLGFLGFSINVLTLLAIILAIGLVVDDAIVMLENIQRRIDEGEPPLLAAYRGAKQVAFAIIATTLTLIAVFVPISFMGGNVGRLFAEFGFTLAAAVIFSSLVALTLAPMLCSKWLQHSPESEEGHRLWAFSEKVLNGLTNGYKKLLTFSLNQPGLLLGLGVAGLIIATVIFPRLPQELAPTEDRGVIIMPASAPRGSTVEYTDHFVRQAETQLLPYLDEGIAARFLSIVGFRGEEDNAFMIMGLTHWDSRDIKQQQVTSEIRQKLADISGVRINVINPPGLGQRGFNQPVEFVIAGPDYESVQAWSEEIVERAKENPNLINVDTDFELTRPELRLNIDRDRAADLDITVQDVGLTLQTMLASRNVTTYVDRGREYDVIIQADDADRATPGDLEQIFLRPREGGELIPIKALVSVEEIGANPDLRRIDRLPAVVISASLADGYDLGSALTYLNNLAVDNLPPEARLSYKGLSREFQDSSAAIYLTFGLAFVIVFLVLAAQFESWIHPLIIMLSVPLAVTGALIALAWSGISLNIYSQIGIIMLLGLMAKNGILIVEFANQLRDKGYEVRDAILEGATLRFRPVLMTTISTVFGAIPLVIATGAGAESRAAIGMVILGGLVFATTLTLFIIPVLYNLLARFAKSSNAVEKELERLASGSAGGSGLAANPGKRADDF
ncbi:MAG: efflux RND transporter permease subunit [Marinobacter sp.]|uniref:efflux RND transporter permease subunit n=1 Tax=Marinobacter sp. TaxID=50741 RepID=UPI0029C1BE53|nr:efflux RND transporter permease subunit [Marinobacter sp.]MDX5336456.1 efflux RND transporter permease subunit [Marinobacter sp.]MDX5387565.1 efflux RND transporter permease subunit [Marinobacter sp.]MDX5440489.1 efflux RND transporter permease subunit [Alteromonadaceae bacterium]MDX5472900.1 efflux RND transporter permease subunit [Marinobacter sp.]